MCAVAAIATAATTTAATATTTAAAAATAATAATAAAAAVTTARRRRGAALAGGRAQIVLLEALPLRQHSDATDILDHLDAHGRLGRGELDARLVKARVRARARV